MLGCSPLSEAASNITLKTTDDLIWARYESSMSDLDEPPAKTPRKRIKHQLQSLRKNLEKERIDEMVSYFSYFFGQKFEKKDVESRLLAISAKNLHRLASEEPVINTDFESLFKALDARINSFMHVQMEDPKLYDVPPLWISSTQLEKLKLPAGIQSDYWFNTSYLKTANWFFFYVGHEDAYASGNQVWLNGDYARKSGYIFPFIMYVSDLVKFGCDVDRVKCQELYDLLKNHDPLALKLGAQSDETARLPISEIVSYSFERWTLQLEEWPGKTITDIFQNNSPYRPIMDHFKKLMTNYFFTIDDYQTLLRRLVARYLQDPMRARNVRRRLPLEGKRLEEFIQDVFAMYGVPERFEFRIPVAIPGRHTELKWCERKLDPLASQ